MDSAADIAAEHLRERTRLRALAHARARPPRPPAGVRAGAIAAAILLHLIAAIGLYLLMRPKPTVDGGRIEVHLLDALPREPDLPEPPRRTARTEPGPREPVAALRRPKPSASTPVAAAAETSQVTTLDAGALFAPDGTVRLPSVPVQKSAPHAEGIRRGRELMARGLDCDAHEPDDLAHRESAGEEVARKYLAWLNLYNPYAAQRRAEQEEARQTRCRMWRSGALP